MILGLLVLLMIASGWAGQARAASETEATVTLTPDLPPGQTVGTTVTWTVTSDAPEPLSYRLSVGLLGDPLRVMYDYSDSNVFAWTPIEDGTYLIKASVRDGVGQERHTLVAFEITSLAEDEPLVTATDHPLVALYSAPSCPEGQMMRVLFKPLDGKGVSTTTPKPCRAGHSMNFYITGMPQHTTFTVVHQVLNGTREVVERGPLLFHRTGWLEHLFPPRILRTGPKFGTSPLERVMLHSQALPGPLENPLLLATNLEGKIVWYDDKNVDRTPWLFRPVEGGTFLLSLDDGEVADQLLLEIDLAGNVVRQTNTQRVTEQLVAMGYTDPFTSFHHDARRLPNGDTAILGSVERLMKDVQGPGLVNVLGDYVVVLDEDWQVKWAWNPYEHLDVSRTAVLGETCSATTPGCPPLFLTKVANDWMHSNSIDYSPEDGNLIISMRHQDWVIKIDYRDGAGSGEVLWRLGKDGDFTLAAAVLYPWQSHQHDVQFLGPNQILLYDNGNTRCAENPVGCNSRGQIFEIDEQAMTAELGLNVDLGVYALAVSSAQRLANGNYYFDSGILGTPPNYYAEVKEVQPDSTAVYALQVAAPLYRSYRLHSLYYEPGTNEAVLSPVPTARDLTPQ